MRGINENKCRSYEKIHPKYEKKAESQSNIDRIPLLEWPTSPIFSLTWHRSTFFY
jgi:hypothetical protein